MRRFGGPSNVCSTETSRAEQPISEYRNQEIEDLIKRNSEEARGRHAMAKINRSAGRTEASPEWEPADYRQALKDALLVACGEQVTAPHPLASGDIDPAAPFRLTAAVDICLTEVDGIEARQMQRPQRIITALGSQSDLPDILTEVAENIALPRVNRTLRKLLAITTPMDVTNYLAEGFTTVDISEVPELSYSFDVKELPNVFISGMGEPAQLASAACLLVVSREVIVNDDAGVIAAGVRAFSAQAAAKEAAMGFGLFSANGNLADGAAWLSTGAGNRLTGTALDATGLGTALAALRDQATESGTKCDADAAFLVVNGADEVSALGLMDALQHAAPQPRVVVSAHVPATSWFVMADPSEFPVIARATMAGSRDSVWAEAQRKMPNTIDGFGIRSNHAAGYAPVSRVGIVRVDK